MPVTMTCFYLAGLRTFLWGPLFWALYKFMLDQLPQRQGSGMLGWHADYIRLLLVYMVLIARLPGSQQRREIPIGILIVTQTGI